MRQIPLYKDTPLAAVEVATPIDSDPSCQLCKFGESARNICMMAEGDPGGILIVGEYPGVMEDRAGIPFSGPAGRYVRKLVNSYFDGPVAYDNGIRCAPGSTAIGDKQLAACRGHLAATIREVQPKRVIAMGNKAINSVLGRSVQAQSVRRGYGWLYNEDIDGTCTPIPVFELMNPVSAMRNRFLRNWFESDLRYALNCAMPALPPWEEYCYVVENAQDAEYACEALRQELWFSFDTETAGMMYKKEFQVVTLAAVARYSNEVFVWDRDGLIRKPTRGPLIKLLNDRQVKKVGQNLKYDAHAVDSGLGAELANYHGDSRLWRRLLYADVDASLDVMAELVGLGGIKGEAEEALVKACRVIAKARREYIKDKDSFLLDPNGVDPLILAACENPDESSKTYAYGLLPWEILVRYCARDALSTARVCELLEKRLEKNAPVKRVWDVIVKDANQSIKQIECWGIPTSMENAKLYQKHLETKMDDVQNRFAQYKDLKPNSPASVSALLFKKIGLHPPKLTNSGGPSTDSESLKALKGQHPVVDDLLEWRRLTKLHGFAKGIQRHICDDERIHPSFKIDGTRTGRLSAVNPNLQNIARPKDVESKMARDLFVAREGYIFVEADFSQLELRVASMLCQDPKMLKIWQSGVDYHQKTAELISQVAWGIPPSEVTKEHRSKAKVPNFGVIYGMTPKGLAGKIGCTVQEAENIVNAIKGQFTVFNRWCKQQIINARKTGYTHTWWDGQEARRRPLVNIADPDDRRRNGAENASLNTPVQGTASDFCLASIVQLVKWLKEDAVPAELVLTVHDSVMFHVEESAKDEVCYNAVRIMESWPSAGVPLVADLKVGTAWGSLEDYKLA